MRLEPEFSLQFDPLEIDLLAERYGSGEDIDALKAGEKIAAGDFSSKHLRVIACWKSPRRVALIYDNSDAEVTEALQFAVATTTPEKSAIEVLCRLHGVGIPMASAILTAVNPEKYTILDFRALESLGIENWPDTIDFYLTYLKKSRELASLHGKSLRTLDRARWQWSKERSRAQDCSC